MEAIRYENSEIDERIIRAVTEIGYEEMTPIQQSAIPALLEGRDIIGQAQTGTGNISGNSNTKSEDNVALYVSSGQRAGMNNTVGTAYQE